MINMTGDNTRWCDRCGPSVTAVATVRVGVGELDFCGHCLREYTTLLMLPIERELDDAHAA